MDWMQKACAIPGVHRAVALGDDGAFVRFTWGTPDNIDFSMFLDVEGGCMHVVEHDTDALDVETLLSMIETICPHIETDEWTIDVEYFSGCPGALMSEVRRKFEPLEYLVHELPTGVEDVVEFVMIKDWPPAEKESIEAEAFLDIGWSVYVHAPPPQSVRTRVTVGRAEGEWKVVFDPPCTLNRPITDMWLVTTGKRPWGVASCIGGIMKGKHDDLRRNKMPYFGEVDRRNAYAFSGRMSRPKSVDILRGFTVPYNVADVDDRCRDARHYATPARMFVSWLRAWTHVSAALIQRAYRKYRQRRISAALKVIGPALMHWACRPDGPLARQAQKRLGAMRRSRDSLALLCGE